jgi:general stress protein 26
MASLSDSLVRELLEGRYIATFATENPSGSIHMVAVWYWFDGTNVFVATSSRSRKAQNLQSKPAISLMIDSRDPAASFGVTIAGAAQILKDDASKAKNAQIHRKYLSEAALEDPKVGPVFAGWDDITVQISPTSVITWDMREADRQVFGGAFERNPGYLLPLQP